MIKLLETYQDNIIPKLAQEFGLDNIMAVPKVAKVIVNMGIGQIKDSKEELDRAAAELAQITGQKPATKAARKSIASFGTRAGQTVGLATTLRRKRMYDFLNKLFNVVLPRLRDFRGLSKKGFDKHGNYTIGLSEHTVFPEIDLAKVTRAKGLEITIVTNTKDPGKSIRLLQELGMPLEK